MGVLFFHRFFIVRDAERNLCYNNVSNPKGNLIMANTCIVKRIASDPRRRRIFISDIHGNDRLFQTLLEKIGYTPADELYLLGDLIEKGSESLPVLRRVMALQKENPRVYPLCGNCDSVWEAALPSGTYHKYLVGYILSRKDSIFSEMAAEIGFPLSEDMDLSAYSSAVQEHFKEEFAFLASFPHIIETDEFILVHAGIDGGPLEEQDVDRAMKRDAFTETCPVFEKTVVVGHWPVMNYCSRIGSCLPNFNTEKNVVSIDGGNEVKREGQLNALILEDGNYRVDWADDFPIERAEKAQSANSDPLFIDWMHRQVDILERREGGAYCRHRASGKELFIEDQFLYRFHGEDCAGYTTYLLPLEPGDEYAVVDRLPGKILAKKQGVIGWVLEK